MRLFIKAFFLIFSLLTIHSAFSVTNKVNNASTKNLSPQLSPQILSQTYTLTEIKDPNVFAFFSKLLPSTPISKIYSTPYKDIYAATAGDNIFYGLIGSPFLFVGHLFNPYTQQDITTDIENIRLADIKVDISKVNIENAILVKGKNNPTGKKIVIFEDPDCPYCRLLEQQLVSSGIDVKLDIYKILVPLPMHPNAKQHVTNIYCAQNDDKNLILENYMLKESDNQVVQLKKDCSADSIIEQNAETAKVFKVSGTPTVILGNGKLLQGSDINSITDYANSQANQARIESTVKGN